MAYITEANECHIKFISEVFDRTLASKDRKIFHDFNPKPEGHYYYEDVLNFHEKQQESNPEYGYNYGHFTIADNMSLTQEKVNKEITTYDPKSVWFQRDILGRRKQADGLVYQMFNHDFHIVPTEPRPYTDYYISNDYGVQHPCVFLLFGLHNDTWYLVKEKYHHGAKEGQKTVEDYYSDLVEFAGNLEIRQMILDNAPIASSFNVHFKRQRPFRSTNANDDVAPGIQNVTTALTTGKLKINDCCENTKREFGLYRWKENSVADEPLKENDDCMAGIRYFVNTKWRLFR